MKTRIIFTQFLLFTFYLQAQDYKPMLDADACWHTTFFDNISLPPIMEPGTQYWLNAANDTLVNGLEYVKLFSYSQTIDPMQGSLNYTLLGYLREDTEAQKVYYLNVVEDYGWLDCGGEEILLYDFSAEVGDTVFHCSSSNYFYIIQEIQTVNNYESAQIDFSGETGGRIYQVFANEFNFTTIYEGIGSDASPIHFPINVSTPGSEMLTSYVKGCALILDNTEEKQFLDVAIFPNPARNSFLLAGNDLSQIQEILLVDQTGKTWKRINYQDGSAVISINDAPTGLYFVYGLDEEKRMIFREKIIVRK